MNLFKFNWLLFRREFIEAYKKHRIEKHMLRMFYKTVDSAIAKCEMHPRKYYIVQKSISEWEILGSQEVRKMKKFSEARKDQTFMHLHETAPYISPENIERWKHERLRRKNKMWFMFIESYYKPITKEEIKVLSLARRCATIQGDAWLENELLKLIQKHEGGH